MIVNIRGWKAAFDRDTLVARGVACCATLAVTVHEAWYQG